VSVSLVLSVIWILSGALIVKLLSAWDQLPDRVAVHFNTALQPNGWSSKRGLAATVLIAVLGQTALATFVLLRVAGATGMIGPILLIVNIVLVSALWQTINYNAEGTPLRLSWFLVPLIVLLVVTFVSSLKGMATVYRR
jgi:hypothetical protein